ncbi:hypothetical protein ABB37_02014 [Leptomonas pyrrhocoris]|uniref:Uncharacterized protein n=1 Tax=Leptomonas pyrrhocoris TaxID=157538 RepID=A0A0N1J573_LEPPY|nr:hypothetical protein ABB37_02014 [Leptomonas pyrrhocoris]KPA83794.1 hypothetical protein ABB37_02014 [Leptomonas pyrrhocoris]|eukprot:XP_015662233.1 hypothetical protein ABB37_02014 [Leptomonas pyrrhocoris]
MMPTEHDVRHLSVFFDCRRGEGNDMKGYEAFRKVTYEQCSQLLSMASFHGTQLSHLRVSLYLVSHVDIRSYQHPLTALADAAYHPWLSVVERMNSEAVHSPEFPSGTTRSAFVNKMEVVKAAIHNVLRGAPHRHLVLFCSTFVSLTEATHSLADLQAGPLSQQTCCVLPDWAAVRVTAARLHDRLRLYRCPFNPTQLRCALQDVLRPYLLPGLPSARRITLQLGSREVSCRATVLHYADSIRRCCALSDFAPSHVTPSGGYFAGPLVQCCPTECVRHEAVAQGAQAQPCILQLRAVLEADTVDEAMLFGDTWELTWDDDSRGAAADSMTASALDAYTAFHAFRAAFRDDILVFTGDARGIVSSCHLAMRLHHFVAYDCADRTMRLREVVPTELRFVPLMPPPPSGGANGSGGGRTQRDAALQRQFGSLRQQLAAQCRSPEFSLDELLRADVCAVAREVRPDTVRELRLSCSNLLH